MHNAKPFQTISIFAILLTIFTLPLFFLQSFMSTHVLPKLILLGVGITLIITAKITKVLINRKIEFTTSYFDLPVILFCLTYIVASILRTPNKMEAFFLPGTTSFIIAGTILYFSITQFSKKLKNLTIAILISSGILTSLIFLTSTLGIFKSLNFGPDFLKSTFTTFDSLLGHLIFTATLIITTLALLANKPKVSIRGFLLSTLILFTLTSYILVTRLLPGKQFNPNLLGFKESWIIAVDSIKDQPLFGSGPGNYVSSFTRFKTLNYNTTTNWNTAHFTARNFYFTIMTETGLLGVFLMILFILYWIKALQKNPNPIAVPTLFLLLLLAFFPPTPTL